jgi:hypothetical protein
MTNARDVKIVNHAFLMLGDTGSGKTTQLLTLPGKKFAYLFDSNAILSLRGYDVEYEAFLPEELNLSIRSLSKGKGDNTTAYQNDVYLQWERDFQDRIKDGFFNNYDVIAIDSATTFLDLIMDRILTINGRPGAWPQQDDYGPQMLAFTNVCRTLMGLGKTIYMTGHMEIKQDNLTQRIFRKPMMTGRLTTKIPLLFSDIFVTECDNLTDGKMAYKIQTVPDRMTTTVRTSIKGLDPFEDVTLDFNKPLESQGLGAILTWDKGNEQ